MPPLQITVEFAPTSMMPLPSAWQFAPQVMSPQLTAQLSPHRQMQSSVLPLQVRLQSFSQNITQLSVGQLHPASVQTHWVPVQESGPGAPW
jgi:hypothetical protein